MAVARYLPLALLGTLVWVAQLSAQIPTGTITGRIIDETTLEPVAGAAVTVAERGALTGLDGRFTITDVPVGTHTLRVRRLGYEELTRTVSVRTDETVTLEISLAVRVVELEELVAIGYGEREARDLTGVVETVGPEEFNTGRVVSPEELIQGKVAGVQIIDSGEPGGVIFLRIRGGTSVETSNEPLFVVDGVPLAVGGGLSAGRNPFNFINPDDIERITVLKDASATAIYGSRGANGVVIIETKRGQETQITYSGSVSGSGVTGEPDILNAEQFRQAVDSFAPSRAGMLGNANTDWRDAVQRSAAGQEHSVALSGSSGDTRYRLSIGYLEQDGVVRGSTTERASVALNFDHRLLDERLDVQANVRGARTDDLFQPGGVLFSATLFAPTQPIRDGNPETGGYFEWEDALAPGNPVAQLDLIRDEGTTYRSVGNIQGEYRLPFVEGLSATLNLGYDVTKADRKSFTPSTLRGGIGSVSRSNSTLAGTVLDAYANYRTRLERYDSDIDLTAGWSYEESRGEFPSFVADSLSLDLLGLSGVPAAGDQNIFCCFVRESRLASVFARANYVFRDKYLATVSVRRDGSSRFGPANQWGTFPAVALAWRLGSEPFLAGFESLSDLKLRLSWGVNGNQSFGDYQFISSYSIGDPRAQTQFGDRFITTIRPSAVDPDIKWEETTSYNVGLDYGFLDGRFSGSIDYYFKETEDLIFRVPVAAGTNLSNFVTTNIGSVENRGFEFSLDAVILDGAGGGLSWVAGFNAATNDNELTRINPFGGGDVILRGGIAGGVGNMIQVLQPGSPVNSFYVFRHKRGPDGRPLYEDVDGDGTVEDSEIYEDINKDGEVNQDDRAPFESPAPDWIFGHTSRMQYRNFDLSFTLRAHLGNYVYNNVASNQGHFRVLTQSSVPNNLHASVLENGFDREQYFSDVYVEDASFLRMDNISLGYTFQGPGAQPIRVFGTVQNVFTATGYSGVDPEAGVNGIDNNIYPRSRTFTAGVGVRF